jgi:hypothetical protein
LSDRWLRQEEAKRQMSRKGARRVVRVCLLTLFCLAASLVSGLPQAGAHDAARSAHAARETLLGVDDTMLLGAMLGLLSAGVALMILGASRPRRHR